MKKFIQSLKCSLNGLKIVSLEERNFQIHIIIGICAITLGFALDITVVEMLLLVIAVALVLASEAINTAIEDICNFVEPNQNPMIGRIKDISAGFVLICAAASIAIGLAVFLPYF